MNERHSEESENRPDRAAMEAPLQSTYEIEVVLRRLRPTASSVQFEAIERAIAERDAGVRQSSRNEVRPQVVNFPVGRSRVGSSRRNIAIVGSWCFGVVVGAAATAAVMLLIRPPAASESAPVAVHQQAPAQVGGMDVAPAAPETRGLESGAAPLDEQPPEFDLEANVRQLASDRLLMQIIDDPQSARIGKWRELLALHRHVPAIGGLAPQIDPLRKTDGVQRLPTERPVELDFHSTPQHIAPEPRTPTRRQMWQELLDDPEMLL